MFQRFVELENCIRSTQGLLNESLPYLSLEKWKIIKELCQILKYFEEGTTCASGENYISAALVIVLNRSLLNVCEKLKQKNFSKVSKEVIISLEGELRKRLGNVEYSNTLALCTFLDPRFKTFVFKHNDAIESIKKLLTNLVADMVSDSLEETSKNQNQL